MPNDLVRIEIETALRHDVAIIPVLIEGARMPRSDELPDSIAALADYNAIEISPTHFESSVRRLIESIKTNEVEAEARAAQQRAVAQSQRNSRVTRISLMSATGKKSPRIRILSIRWNIAAHSAIRKPLPDESVNDNDNYKRVLASYTLLDSAWTNAVLRFGKANPLILATTIKHQGKRLAKVTFDDDWMTIAANTADLRAFVRKIEPREPREDSPGFAGAIPDDEITTRFGQLSEQVVGQIVCLSKVHSAAAESYKRSLGLPNREG